MRLQGRLDLRDHLRRATNVLMAGSIFIVLHDFSLGGTERICLRLARRWAKLDRTVTIFCGNEQGPLRALAGGDVRIVAAKPAIARGSGSRLALARSAAAFLKQNPADVCFIPGNYHWPVIPALARICRRDRGIIAAQISADLRKPQRTRLRQYLFDRRMRVLLRGADGLVAMSEQAARAAKSVLPNPVRIIPLPALEDDGAPPTALPQGSPVVLGAGRLVPEKGFAALIEAFARIPVTDARLMIAGSGPQEGRLKDQAKKLGISGKVTFLGYLEDIRPALDGASLFVLPSKFEGFGAVVIEALAAGRPIVMTDCSPAADLVRGSDSGLVVPIDNVEALAEAMSSMIGRTRHDPARAAASVSPHRIGAAAPQYLDFFDELRRSVEH